MDAREIILELPNLRLAARVWGDLSLPRLLALHGWLDNAASFDTLAPLLCDRFHIVAVDLPGHGRSDHRPPGTWYHFVDSASDLLAALDVLGWTRFGLLGHSMGGAIATLIAAACPERVERLHLIDALGPLTTPAHEAPALLQRALQQLGQIDTKTLRVFASEAEAIDARQQANGLTRQASECLVLRSLDAVPGGYRWSSDPRLRLASPQRYTEEQMLAILRAIRAPTQLILALPLASFLPEAMISARIAQVQDIEVVRLKGSHHVHLEDPQPVAAAIRAFRAA
ncbi:MAG TPA: alpha/beta hydrolase [Rudaea sp.]